MVKQNLEISCPTASHVSPNINYINIPDVERMKEEYEHFFMASPHMFCIAGGDGSFRKLNPAWESSLGFTQEELRAKPLSAFIHPEDREATFAEMQKLGAGLDTAIFESRFLCKTGAYKRLAWSATLSSEREAIYITAHDITKRKHLEEALIRQTQDLIRANAELTQSNQELDDFAYIASHDLKEPLRGIHNYSTFLLEDYQDILDDTGRAKLHTLTRLAQRMETLIDSLLYFSRVGRVELATEETDLNQTVSEVLDSLAIPLQTAGVEVRLSTSLPRIPCDQARVGEIFLNLITNAMKYNDKPQKWIEIGVGEGLDQPGLCAPGSQVFYVRDNGIGIRDKHQEAIFRIFKRLHARDKYGGGTGAGLTVVKKIVERHGGRIWVESAPGEGSTFYFTLEGQGKRGDGYDNPSLGELS